MTVSHKAWCRIPKSNTDTAVLCIHGILGSPAHFKWLLPQIPQEWAVYSILLRGHGGTADDFASASMEQWREQVRKMMQKLAKQYENIWIVGHSMGTLLAIESAAACGKVRGMFLLGVPLRPHVTVQAVRESLQVLFRKIPPDDRWAAAARDAYSIRPDRRLWRYLRWIPQYLGLFSEMRRARKLLPKLYIPCVAVQSVKDELVSMRTMHDLRENTSFYCIALPDSGHFYLAPDDAKITADALFGLMHG